MKLRRPVDNIGRVRCRVDARSGSRAAGATNSDLIEATDNIAAPNALNHDCKVIWKQELRGCHARFRVHSHRDQRYPAPWWICPSVREGPPPLQNRVSKFLTRKFSGRWLQARVRERK